MPFLIDGNNLMHALSAAGADVGRHGLCRLLVVLKQSNKRVHVVFDGPAPPRGMADQIDLEGINVSYSSPVSADEVICECITADSAPRRLTVVSSDRQIRTAARKRRCKTVKSDQFAQDLLRLNAPSPPSRPNDPPEKHNGLTDAQTRQWLKEFGYDK